MIKIGVLIISDKGSRGERANACGDVIREMAKEIDGEVAAYAVIPDEQPMIEAYLIDYADNQRLDLVLTSGGTGVSPRDVTPEATRAVVQKPAPGIPEAMRLASLKITPRAMLTRAVAGIRERTMIINLPESPRAVRECLAAVLPTLPHGLAILRGEAFECAAPALKDNPNPDNEQLPEQLYDEYTWLPRLDQLLIEIAREGYDWIMAYDGEGEKYGLELRDRATGEKIRELNPDKDGYLISKSVEDAVAQALLWILELKGSSS